MTRITLLKTLSIAAGAVCVTLSCASASHAALLGPTRYEQFSDSPFAGGSFDYFHLENFEDHLLNTPGVSADLGGVTSVLFGFGLTDSVDADDGTIDGSGLNGDSYFAPGIPGIRFTFNASLLSGFLPNAVGIVWTDGGGLTSFKAFGPGGVDLGTIGPVNIADGSITGTTVEDNFFGIEGLGPIESILISNTAGGIEVDHLQYGRRSASDPTIPTPALFPSLIAMGGALWRKRKATAFAEASESV
jgi:hypothetical protein